MDQTTHSRDRFDIPPAHRRTPSSFGARPTAFLAVVAWTVFALTVCTLPAAADRGYGEQDGYGYGQDGYGQNYNGYDAYEDRYEEGGTYSYPRVLEGSATLILEDGDREPVEINQPIFVGDRLWVPYGSRLEVLLADRSILRIQGEGEVHFESVAYSADSGDRDTQLRLLQGEMQLVVPRDAHGDSLPRIELARSTVYIHREGTFRIQADRRGWAEVTVRDGLAEMVGDRNSRLVHSGEMGFSRGGYRPHFELTRAGGWSTLERWGDRLSDEARYAYDHNSHVDGSLRYAAAPLARHGNWVRVGSSWGWRPTLEISWRPFSRGHWRNTRVGLTWVSSDPWGWVTHHYGSWDYHNRHGWVWYPGRVYAPARVHWYWGPSYVGWCPTGYYERHYRRHGGRFGLSVGIYGRAGGHVDLFTHWSFSTTVHFGRRAHRRHVYSHADLRGRGHHRLEHGIITASRGFEYRGARDTYSHLDRQIRRQNRQAPDVTNFVARKPLADTVAQRVLRAEKPGRVRTPATTATGNRADNRGPQARAEKPGRVRTPATTTPGNRADNRGTRSRAEKPTALPPYRENRGRDVRDRDAGDRKAPVATETNRRPGTGTVYRSRTENRDTATRAERPRTSQPRAERPRTERPRAEKPRTSRETTRPQADRTSRPRAAQPRGRTIDNDPNRGTWHRPEAQKPRTDRNRGSRATNPSRATPPRTSPQRTERPRATNPSRATPPRTSPQRTERPRATKPRTSQPRASQPSRPRASQPRASQPSKPRVNQPRVNQPRASQPRANQPRASKPRASQPKADKPARNNSRGNRSADKAQQKRKRDNG